MTLPPVSRRGFLTTAATATAAVTLPALPRPAVASPASRADGITLGVASYSLRKFTREQAIKMCQALRVHTITIKDVHLPRTDPPQVVAVNAREFTAAGLTILGGGTIYWKVADEAEIRKDFDYAKAAGMPLMVCGPNPETLDIVEKLVKEYDIKVALHNHGPEDALYPTPQDAFKVIEKRDRRMGLCIDVGHTARAGQDVPTTIRDLGPRVLDMHLKDLADVKRKGSDIQCGRGVLDLPGILRALVAVNFKGHAALEYELDENDPIAGMQESLAYLRGVLAGIQRT